MVFLVARPVFPLKFSPESLFVLSINLFVFVPDNSGLVYLS